MSLPWSPSRQPGVRGNPEEDWLISEISRVLDPLSFFFLDWTFHGCICQPFGTREGTKSLYVLLRIKINTIIRGECKLMFLNSKLLLT